MCKKRISMIIGAGVPLNFDLPDNIITPSTDKITKEVIRPYNIFSFSSTDKQSYIVQQIYERLITNYPLAPSQSMNWKAAENTKPNIHFEILFHILEMYLAYKKAWDGKCKNGEIFPYFALFSNDAVNYKYEDILKIKDEFIVRIMDIVDGYNEYYKRNLNGKEKWYADFFRFFKNRLDIFNFNYDTTIEDSIRSYEDGFEESPNEYGLKCFSPKKLWENRKNLSTINHIHGCILYFQAKDDKGRYMYNMIHDMCKYPDYQTMKNRFIGTGYSDPVSQDHTEYIAGPIITGLRKTEKLNCIPYDFYHGHLYNSILHNSSLIIAGYSFGDVYTNQLLFRMGLIHREKARIVLIDYWNYDSDTENGLSFFLKTKPSKDLITFLLMMAEIDSLDAFCNNLIKNSPDYFTTKNGRLMIFTTGFKKATMHKEEILSFIN